MEEGEEYCSKGIGDIFKRIITENSPELRKEMPIQIEEAFRTPNIQGWKGISPGRKTIKTLSTQNKGNTLNGTRVIYKGRPNRATAAYSTETLKAKRA